MDTMSNISKDWLQYLDGKITINDIIEAYESRGFDSNQDIPGNYHWEELYQALGPETKVILTVRDDTERKCFVNVDTNINRTFTLTYRTPSLEFSKFLSVPKLYVKRASNMSMLRPGQYL